ncbi:MAG: hypothetical protein V2I45_11930 [Halieaceae bacterium]|jgi:hypothetical protein|nr:hypothetical protein [Halieaceae bacterium]
MAARHVLKFLHTLGAIGMLGAMACLLAALTLIVDPTEDLQTYAAQRDIMNAIAGWILLPSLGITIVSGLFSMAVVKGYHNAGWAWMKLATGVVMFEGTLLAVQGPIEAEAAKVQQALNGGVDVMALAMTVSAEWSSLWVLGAVAIANVALGVWRPRFGRASRR